MLSPILAVDEGIHTFHSPGPVVLQTAHIVLLHIVHDGLDESLVEVAVTKFCHFPEKKVAHLLKCLSLLRIASEYHCASVRLGYKLCK